MIPRARVLPFQGWKHWNIFFPPLVNTAFKSLCSQNSEIWNWCPVHSPLSPQKPADLAGKWRRWGTWASLSSVVKWKGGGGMRRSLRREREREAGRELGSLQESQVRCGFAFGKLSHGPPLWGALDGPQVREIPTGLLTWCCKTKRTGCCLVSWVTFKALKRCHGLALLAGDP